MTDIIAIAATVLAEAGFAMTKVAPRGGFALAFEDATVIGFLLAYEDPSQLIGAWRQDADRLIADHQLALRRAAQKAWNTYVVLLTTAEANYSQSVALSAIEEDLTGTRKICRASVRDITDVRAALLPLLPIQAPPRLEAIEMANEIRQRTTGLSSRAVEAFLSAAEDSVVLQILEEGS